MPYLMLIIDELALVLRDPNSEIRDRAMLELGAILNVSRATGGHCMLCTQRPSVDIISGYLKATISARIAFGVPTQADSRVIIDNSNAADIDIPGRAWMLHGARAIQMQTPWITPKQIRTIIDETTKREEGRQPDQVSIEELVTISMEKCDGWMSQNKLKAELGDRMGWDQLKQLLVDLDGEVVSDTSGNHYQVVNQGRGIGRRLQPVLFDESVEDNGHRSEVGDSAAW
jgi:DNA segregation ATPase FtsK/SpoIIIE-like protein